MEKGLNRVVRDRSVGGLGMARKSGGGQRRGRNQQRAMYDELDKYPSCHRMLSQELCVIREP